MNDGFNRRKFISSLAAPGVMLALTPNFDRISTAKGASTTQPGITSRDSDAAFFAKLRKHFLLPSNVAYCNTGTLGASPREVVEALTNGIRRNESQLADWPYEHPDGEPLTGYQELRDVRAVVGRFINANADEIALTQNATMGMNFLANGLDLSAGDEVISTDQEHVGGISCWRLLAKRRGIVLKELPLEPALKDGPGAVLNLFADAASPRTRVVVFSHITSGLGIRMPVRELCKLARDRRVLSIIDGAQAVGQIRVDVKDLDCDAYVASPHKWLLAPKGTGFLYVGREVQDRVWTTLASTAWHDHEKGAFRFMQYGTGSVPVVDGLVAALKFINRVGMDRIEGWDAMLTKRLRDGLKEIKNARLSSPLDARFAGAITTFRVEGTTAKALQDALWARRVRVRAVGEARGVRLSAHMYVAPADIDTVLEVVSRL